ncbi:MAG: hypothetical protein F4Y18_05675 [Cenarchaeum sp. SB0663_bin_5]|nr:hypothetical protein [Cenarchaeum sp. SB0663_bin_5]MYH04334.1 hypothetical protein [Cenarchaeum sp. SB0675_bin_21]MYL10736.1 hypothetical protein [Cenarchaeum sp. SB0669_bin_11]
MEFSGVIDSGDNDISLDWSFPSHMYVENHDDDIWNDCLYVNYEDATLSHYGIDSDGIYYCGANVPSYHHGVSNYPCPYVDSGEVNVLRTWVDYADDDSDNDRNIALNPFIRVLILE